MHQSAGTITSSVNPIDTSLLAEALTQTAILSSAGIASNQASSYSRMVDNCIQVHRCKTDITGWLQGGHPTFKDGIVDREDCFHGWESFCYRIVQIRVRKCQGFYVYELNPSPEGGIATVQENERYQVLQYDLRNSGSYKRDFMSRTLCLRKLLMSLLIMI